MPIQSCSKDGKSGHKWGDQGACYTGSGSRAKAARQGRAVEAQKNNLKTLQINIKGFTSNVMTRLETLKGVEYIVAPVNMIVEGVLPGSSGPILYSAEELANSVNFWDNVPVTINHPQIDGIYVSARSPEIMEQFSVGRIFNTYFDAETNTLKAEAWIEKETLQNNFADVYNMLINGNANIEVSTGVLHYENGQQGDFNGVAYNGIGSDFYGDHLALLPNDIGACSWTDGCGLRVNSKTEKQRPFIFNQLDNSSIMNLIFQQVDAKDDSTYIYYVYAVFDDYFVYRQTLIEGGQQKLYKQNYSIENNVLALSDNTIRIKEERNFIPIPEDAVEPSGVSSINQNEGDEMAKIEPCCPEKVKSLIGANNSFTQDDETWLLALDAKALESVTAMAKEVKTVIINEVKEVIEVEITPREFANSAPENIKSYFNALIDADEKKKADIVANLIANENCLFSNEELEAFSVNQLEKMAGLTTAKEPDPNTIEPLADMSANSASIVQPEIAEIKDKDILLTPNVNWSKQQ